jgi:hypothetical protein
MLGWHYRNSKWDRLRIVRVIKAVASHAEKEMCELPVIGHQILPTFGAPGVNTLNTPKTVEQIAR